MSRMPNGLERAAFGGNGGTVFDPEAGALRLKASADRCEAVLDRALPPVAMHEATVAPARGAMGLVPNWDMAVGGMRRLDGAHGVMLSPLARMVAEARARHRGDGAFVPPFNPGQVQVAEDYAALVEWREGSAMRGQNLQGGRGGSDSGVFIDTFIQQGLWLAEMHRRIGGATAMAPRRHMDRGNARRAITVRAAVDMVCIAGRSLSEVLVAFGWVAKGETRDELRGHVRGALDRMQGYRE